MSIPFSAYGYCGGDGINRSDPSGKLWPAVLAGVAVAVGITITAQYILFDAGGNEVILGPPPATSENLKFVLQAPAQVGPAIRSRYPLTTILTKSRTENENQKVIY